MRPEGQGFGCWCLRGSSPAARLSHGDNCSVAFLIDKSATCSPCLIFASIHSYVEGFSDPLKQLEYAGGHALNFSTSTHHYIYIYIHQRGKLTDLRLIGDLVPLAMWTVMRKAYISTALQVGRRKMAFRRMKTIDQVEARLRSC